METPETVEITFTETRVVDDERKGTYREERYEEGKTYNLNPRSADRWVKRGAAFFATDEDAARAYGASRDAGTRLSDSAKVDEGGNEHGPVNYDAMSRADLTKIAKKRGLEITGLKTKEDFAELLKGEDAKAAAIDYSDLSDDDVRAKLQERGIDVSAIDSREAAIARLEELDEAARSGGGA